MNRADVYPTVPRLLPADPSEPHWCGWPVDKAVWQAHDGKCSEDGTPHPRPSKDRHEGGGE